MVGVKKLSKADLYIGQGTSGVELTVIPLECESQMALS